MKWRLTIRWSPLQDPVSLRSWDERPSALEEHQDPVKLDERSRLALLAGRTVFDRPEIQPDLPREGILSEMRAGCSLKNHQDLRPSKNEGLRQLKAIRRTRR